MLSSFELWAAVIALCVVGVVYLGFDVIHESARGNAPEATWGNHALVGAVCLYIALLVITALI